MLNKSTRDYITPKLIKVMFQLIERDSLDGIELDVLIDYMGLINRMVYSESEARPYIKELIEKGMIEEKNGKYYPLGDTKK